MSISIVGYIALGGVLMLIGMIAFRFFFFQHLTFNTIECQGLRIVDEDGKGRMVFGVAEDGAVFGIYDTNNEPVIGFVDDEGAGRISLYNNDEIVMVLGTTEDNASRISIYDNGELAINLGTIENAGYITIFNNGKTAMGLGAEDGGIKVCDSNGTTKIGIGVHEGDGWVMTANKNGEKDSLGGNQV